MKPLVLLVDDHSLSRGALARQLTTCGFTVFEADTLAEARPLLATEHLQALLLDHQLPDGLGLDWVPEVRLHHPLLPIIMISGYADIPLAVEAVRRGANQFLTKPVEVDQLSAALHRLIENLPAAAAGQADPFWDLSPAFREQVRLAAVAAEHSCPILLRGETGSGKGYLARWIHNHSRRNRAPFVEINCSGLRGELLASELFGHTRGAFTGAVQEKMGLIEAADGGTLFLDEIADMDFALQAQLLKVIEEKEYRRLGEVRMRRSDFRLLCATHSDLDQAVRARTFREDLLFRINVFPIALAPLRSAGADLSRCIAYFLRQIPGPQRDVTPDALMLLFHHAWPGNIREMRNVLERAVMLAGNGRILPDHLPALRAPAPPAPAAFNLHALEADRIQAALAACEGNATQAARVLGISRATLYRRMKPGL